MRWALRLAAVIWLGTAVPAAAEDGDPLEPFNRLAFAASRLFAEEVMAPAAEQAARVVPAPIRAAFGNAYANLVDLSTAAAHLAAGASADGAAAIGRVLINSTLGLAGFYDLATAFGLPRQELSFGEALCRLGLPPDPYLVLPVIGPTHVAGAGLVAGAYALDAWSGWMSLLGPARIALDVGVAAAALRYAGTMPPPDLPDPYGLQRAEYRSLMGRSCGAYRPALPTYAATAPAAAATH